MWNKLTKTKGVNILFLLLYDDEHSVYYQAEGKSQFKITGIVEKGILGLESE